MSRGTKGWPPTAVRERRVLRIVRARTASIGKSENPRAKQRPGHSALFN